MRRPERPRREHRMIRIDEAGDAVDRARGDGLLVVERWQDRRQRSGEHRLAGAWRSDQEEVVSSRRGNLEGPFRRFLSGDVAEVDLVRGFLRSFGHGRRRDPRTALEMCDDLA
jgi:hypothetical protein